MITDMLATMLGVPHACVSLVDRDRVWFKATYGIDATEVGREPGFCTTLVEGDEDVRYIEDAQVDPETKENSLVHGGPKIRFYAGAPLVTEGGHRVGTLCAFGPEPRSFDDQERASLLNLTTLVMHEMELRKTRNQLERTEEALAASQRLDSLGLVASGVAHDFNNLLCAILGNLELLRFELPRKARVDELLGEIEATGRRAADLAGQVLAYAGGDGAPMCSIDLNELVIETHRMVKGAIGNKVDVEFSLRRGLPMVHGQPTGLRQVLVNLLMNAAQACDETRGGVRVETDAVEGSNEVLLRVVDSGPGISESVRKRVFEPFVSSKASGRGLGLSICKRIVDQHDGSIEIDSVDGVGTSVTVRFPQAQEAPELDVAAGPDDLPGPGEGAILVVDDEEAVRAMAGASLERAGFRVESAAGGQEAIDRLEGHADDYRALLLDWSMPAVNGDDVLAHMEALGIDLPVILSSGHPENPVSAGRKRSPLVKGFLKKPYTRADLLGHLGDVLVTSSG